MPRFFFSPYTRVGVKPVFQLSYLGSLDLKATSGTLTCPVNFVAFGFSGLARYRTLFQPVQRKSLKFARLSLLNPMDINT